MGRKLSPRPRSVKKTPRRRPSASTDTSVGADQLADGAACLDRLRFNRWKRQQQLEQEPPARPDDLLPLAAALASLHGLRALVADVLAAAEALSAAPTNEALGTTLERKAWRLADLLQGGDNDGLISAAFAIADAGNAARTRGRLTDEEIATYRIIGREKAATAEQAERERQKQQAVGAAEQGVVESWAALDEDQRSLSALRLLVRSGVLRLPDGRLRLAMGVL